jgi:hypothetical protein
MAMVKGLLENFIATTDGRPGKPTPAENWLLTVRLDGSDYRGRTGSPIVLAVLETALRTRRTWGIELDLSDASAPVTPTIERVRVVDDRPTICTGGDIVDLPNGERVRPLTPTAFADEDPVKWGFFFNLPGTGKCHEYKGTSLDAYATVQGAWLDHGTVALTFDSSGLITAAQRT